MEMFNFYTAYTQMELLYGVSMTPDQFENIAIIGYDKIGNKATEIKQGVFDVEDHRLKLPCDISSIEAVTTNKVDYQKTSPIYDSYNNIYNNTAEQYIEHLKRNSDPLYTKGEFVKYKQIDNRTLYIPENYKKVFVMYTVPVVGDDELPMLNQKEVNALACYCAYIDTFKKGMSTRDANMINLAGALEQKWLRLCDYARTPVSMSQNDFDIIGDVKTSWDRKTYGKSYKGFK
jgi:hypothetical protein